MKRSIKISYNTGRECHPAKYVLRIAIGVVSCLTLVGCEPGLRHTTLIHKHSSRAAGSSRILSDLFASYYKRTEAVFDVALLIKPREPSMPGFEVHLAPLLVYELSDSDKPGPFAPLGALYIDSNGTPAVDLALPTVYLEEGEVPIGNRSYPSMTFRWYHHRDPGQTNMIEEVGLRIIHDDDGYALLMEVAQSIHQDALNHAVRLFFAAESVELEAREKIGPPAPGRRYALESSLEDAPYAIVAKVIGDGPVPMGPFVYLSNHPQRVTTLLCRCSASQMNEVADTLEYDLAPFDTVSAIVSKPGHQINRREFKSIEKSIRWPFGLEQATNPEARH